MVSTKILTYCTFNVTQNSTWRDESSIMTEIWFNKQYCNEFPCWRCVAVCQEFTERHNLDWHSIQLMKVHGNATAGGMKAWYYKEVELFVPYQHFYYLKNWAECEHLLTFAYLPTSFSCQSVRVRVIIHVTIILLLFLWMATYTHFWSEEHLVICPKCSVILLYCLAPYDCLFYCEII